jgi:hypothetical protein
MGATFGVSNITIEKERAFFEFNDFKSFMKSELLEAVEKSMGKAYISMGNKARIEFKREQEDNSMMLTLMREFLESIKI